MIRLQETLAMARVELRLCRRLVRYWVFLGLAYLLAIVAYLYYSLLHMLGSSWSATASMIGPRYLMGAVGTYAVLVFVLGIIFLGFDVRARDVRERMVEVLDARPCTNLELVTGRFLGLLLACWAPVTLLALLIQLLGFLLRALGAPLGEPVEPWSLLLLIVFMSLPAMAFSLALVFVVTLAVRNRLIAAVLLLGSLGLLVWATFRMRLPLVPLVDLTGGFGLGFPSDLVPGLGDPAGWLQRGGVLVAAVGLLVLAAAIHPRPDEGSRPRAVAAAVAVLLLGGLMVGATAGLRLRDVSQLDAWRKAHQARRDEPAPDLDAITGTVQIEPGRRLGLDLDVAFRAPVKRGLASALFTLNPGLVVRSVKGPAGGDLAFTQRDGLLEVRLERPLATGQASSVHLVAEGLPDLLFGYLDAARAVENLTTRDSQLFLLGDRRGMFGRRYVALMPGIRWLPAGGVEVGRDDLRSRPTDFFTVDLQVEVPRGYLVAGPGRRQEAGSEGERVRFRFNPKAPLPEVALLAARFVSRTAEADGVQLEVLVDPGHTRNLDFFSDAAEEIRRAVGDRLKAAREVGLPYPYDALTMVEVPSRLRGYGGSWRLDTTLGPPGLVLVRENCFPTARFDVAFRDPKIKEREGGLPRAKRERLEAHFLNDFSGGNVFMNASRCFVLDQTAAGGAEGVAVNFVLETLATRLATGTRGYFSVHIFDVDLNQSAQRAFVKFFVGGRHGQDFASAVIDAFTCRAEVWEAVLGVALKDLDPGKEPRRTLDVLTLKAGALAESLLDSLGRDKAGGLLHALVEHHRGQTFTRSDLVAAGKGVGADLGPLLALWLDGTDLPGFVGAGSRAFRLPDNADGSPRYQLLTTVRNDEPVAGLLRIAYTAGRDKDKGKDLQHGASDPITLAARSAIEYGTVLSQPPLEVEVRPYLSLNRAPFAISLPKVDEATIVSQAPFEGVRQVAWAPPPADVVVVDDLDAGFAVKGNEKRAGFRLGAKAAPGDTDQGLPVQIMPLPPAQWSRFEAPEAFGKYRHTVAFVRPGRGDPRALFTAPVSRAGRWDLEVYLPAKARFAPFVQKWGTWHLAVVTSSGRQEASFDTAAGGEGWNLVGAYDLPAGQVGVELSNTTDGQAVVADAIRWTPSAGERR